MIAGLVLFFGAHVLTSRREMRARIMTAIGGEHVYKSVYSLLSLAGLALIVWGFAHYRAHEWVQIWTPPKARKHLNIALMLPAVILGVAA